VPRVLIIGAGHAGGSAAAHLRQYGYSGEIMLVGEEATAPYQRPPLSKGYLKEEVDANNLKLKTDDFYASQGIELILSRTVIAIERGAKCVTFADGGEAKYDILIIATGSRPRLLSVPGAALHGILALRTIADADLLKRSLSAAGNVLIIGGGYVGLEVAASARRAGAAVTILEREARCLARVACEPLSRFFERHHRAHGVSIITGAQVMSFVGTGPIEDERSRVRAVNLADGRTLPADVVVVGIGAVPCDELARTAGLRCENGIAVDQQARTSDPSIYAIGDVTWRALPHYDDQRLRLESVPNALEQARQAACAIVGLPAPPPEVPWFWSDQYNLKLQIAGVSLGASEYILRGAPAQEKFAVFHLRGDRILAVEAVNAVPEFMIGKQLIASRRPVSLTRLADTTVPMKEVAVDNYQPASSPLAVG
jgi:3-phenylpropionate/trans-cinnamate dioxygenase ferredoxin reductase subunit